MGTGYRIVVPRPNHQHLHKSKAAAAVDTGRNIAAKRCAISGDIHDKDGIVLTSTWSTTSLFAFWT